MKFEVRTQEPEKPTFKRVSELKKGDVVRNGTLAPISWPTDPFPVGAVYLVVENYEGKKVLVTIPEWDIDGSGDGDEPVWEVLPTATLSI